MQICGRATLMPSDTDSAGPSPYRDGPDPPVFAEAWHAQVLGLAHALTGSGAFTAPAWSSALGASLRRLQGAVADEEQLYYLAALDALESLLERAGRVDAEEVRARVDAWRQAYLDTPHGQPVTLSDG